MRKFYALLKVNLAVMTFMVFSLTVAHAQERTIQGSVTAQEDNSSLPGVSVVVKGTTNGTVTDANGAYKLTVPGSDAVLVFSFVGFATEEVAVGTRTTVNVALASDIKALSEVVVTGYTTENRREVTGAVATVKAKDIVAVPTGNVEQTLQGRVSGVTVITNGQPGTTSIVRLRGFGAFGGNEPLYVVDGVPVGSTNFLSPDDIETTTVLKDAPSASIYGARAANGVIIYTTKRGKKDGKLRVSYDGVYGVTLPGTVNNILNPQEQADWTWNAIRNTARQLGEPQPFEHPQYGNDPNQATLPDYLIVGAQSGVRGNIDLAAERAKYNNDANRGPIYLVARANKAGTNWWDAITRVAPLNRHSLSFASGTERSTFYASLSMQDQQGIILNQSFQRYALRINSEHQIVKNVRIGENIQGLYIENRGLFGGDGGRGAAGDESDVLSAFRMPAIIPVYDEFGGYAGTAAKGFNNPRNPVANRDRQKDNGGYGFGVIGNLYAEWDVISGLTLRSSIGGGVNANNFRFYNIPQYENSENNTTYSYGEGYGAFTNWIFTNQAQYKKKFGVHSIDVLGGIESLNTGTGRNINGTGQSPFSTDLNYVNLTTTINRIVTSNYNPGSTFFSIFGRAQYTFNDKYILNGVIRRDGSSRFGELTRFGVFPAVSAAWRISAEDFMANLPFVTDLKIRGGWGEMGNANINQNNQFSLFSSDLGQAYYDIAGGNGAPREGFFRSRIGNRGAKWETSTTTNVGIDGTFLDGKLDIVFDLWRKDTRDLLYTLETPAVVGPRANPPAINIAQMRNEGIDLQVITRGKVASDFGYEVNLTGSFLSNNIQSLAPGVEYFDVGGTRISGNAIRNQVGRSISSFFGYKVIGLFQNQEEVNNSPAQDGKGVGRFRYQDVNGDGAITPDDRTYLGSPVPNFTGGLNLKLTYKNFELETFLYTALGFQNMNLSKWFTDFYPSFTGAAMGVRVKESFTFERGGNTVPIFENVSNISTNNAYNSYYVENGSFARLTNLQIAYKLPAAFLNRYGIERARVYLQTTNLFTISSYSGLDPGVGGQADTTFGIDVGNPPVTRGFNIGLNLGF